MSFPSQQLPNGLPAATQLDSYNKFQAPPNTGQYPPQMTQQMLTTKLPPPGQQQLQQNQAQQINSHYPQQVQQNRQQQLLVNGGSNSSSRTASPAPNQSVNSSHLPPTQAPKQFVGPSQMSSQNQHLFPPRQPGSLHGSNQNLSDQKSISNPNVANLATNMQNMNITNGQLNRNIATNPYVPNVVNGNTNLFNAPRMPPKINSNFPANSQTIQQAMGPTMQKPPNLQQQQNFNGQMPQQQYPSMPPLNSQSKQVTSPINNMQAQPPQPQFSQSHIPNQMKPPGPALNQPQYPNQFQNNNQPNAGPPLFPPTTTATAATAVNKRPMYPTQSPVQSAPLQQQPPPLQQQPPPLQQQPPPTQTAYPSQQSNAFAGQTNSAPIQYQSSKPSNYPSNPMGVTQQGFNKMWGHETVDLMQQRHILPTTKIIPPTIELGHEFYESVNCSPE